MLLLRRFINGDTVSEEVNVDELDFNLVEIFLKTYLIDPATYKIEIRRFWEQPK